MPKVKEVYRYTEGTEALERATGRVRAGQFPRSKRESPA